MGLTLWKNSSNGKTLFRTYVSVFIDLVGDKDILKDADKISHEIACDKTVSKFEKI